MASNTKVTQSEAPPKASGDKKAIGCVAISDVNTEIHGTITNPLTLSRTHKKEELLDWGVGLDREAPGSTRNDRMMDRNEVTRQCSLNSGADTAPSSVRSSDGSFSSN